MLQPGQPLTHVLTQQFFRLGTAKLRPTQMFEQPLPAPLLHLLEGMGDKSFLTRGRAFGESHVVHPDVAPVGGDQVIGPGGHLLGDRRLAALGDVLEPLDASQDFVEPLEQVGADGEAVAGRALPRWPRAGRWPSPVSRPCSRRSRTTTDCGAPVRAPRPQRGHGGAGVETAGDRDRQAAGASADVEHLAQQSAQFRNGVVIRPAGVGLIAPLPVAFPAEQSALLVKD